MRRVLAFGMVAIGAAVCPASAQSAPLWRSVDLARQLADTMPQRIHVQYGSGRVDVRGASEPLLYQMHLRYDESRSTPVHRYDAEQRSVVLGSEPRPGATRVSRDGEETGELRLALPRSVPLDLDLELAGTQSTLDLGGMALQSLRLEGGAADATLSFSSPNRIPMRELDIGVGAADLVATQLANANADRIRIRGGIGLVDLDFSGSWTHDVAVTTRLALGKLIVRVPSDVGVRVAVERIAAGFEHQGFVKRDDGWYSPNWDRATHHLRISAETYIGKIDIRRGGR
jgi:hypothetical protein